MKTACPGHLCGSAARWLVVHLLLVTALCGTANAQMPNLLREGIRAYDDVALEKAETLLRTVASAKTTSPADRATAWIYIGLCRSLGKTEDEPGMRAAFVKAFAADPLVVLPGHAHSRARDAFHAVLRTRNIAAARLPPFVGRGDVGPRATAPWWTARRKVGAGFLGAAIAFGGASLGFGLSARSAEADFHTNKALSGADSQAAKASRSAAEDRALAANVFLGIGAAAAVTGTLMLLWPGNEKPRSVRLTPSGLGLALSVAY